MLYLKLGLGKNGMRTIMLVVHGIPSVDERVVVISLLMGVCSGDWLAGEGGTV
jgi:hypothetical protein